MVAKENISFASVLLNPLTFGNLRSFTAQDRKLWKTATEAKQNKKQSIAKLTL